MFTSLGVSATMASSYLFASAGILATMVSSYLFTSAGVLATMFNAWRPPCQSEPNTRQIWVGNSVGNSYVTCSSHAAWDPRIKIHFDA